MAKHSLEDAEQFYGWVTQNDSLGKGAYPYSGVRKLSCVVINKVCM